jgi:hypothetical protein
MNRRVLQLLVLLSTLAPTAALADRREFYLTLSLEPQLSRFTEPISGASQASSLGGGATLAAYYGLTNALHLGGAVRFSLTRDVPFSNANIVLPGGAPSHGTVYEDRLGFGATALAAYRVDTGRAFAPVGRLELGFASLSYKNIQHAPAGATYAVEFPGSHELVLEARAGLSGEYRFGDHFVTAVGLQVTVHPGSISPWEVGLPFTLGWAW